MCACVCERLKKVDVFHTDKKGKHLHLASGAVKDRKILGGLVQRPVCSISHLPRAKTASARRFDLSQFLTVNLHYYLVLQIHAKYQDGQF